MGIVERGLTQFISRAGKEPGNDMPYGILAEEGKRREIPIIEFSLPHEIRKDLSKEQLLLLNELRRVSRRLGDLYLVQKNLENLDFWPKDITTLEIEEASKENSGISSPYTYVERDSKGHLRTVPIHEVFKDMIRDRQIVASLKKAADLSGKGKTRDLDLQAYLRARARAFENGNWEYSESLWLEMSEQPKIFIVAGPYDNYLDPHKIKYAWESWVGVLDKPETESAQQFVKEFLAWWQTKTQLETPKVGVRIENTVMMSGQAADYRWMGNSLPCQMGLRQKYGSVFFIFKPVFDETFQEKRLPAYRSTIDSVHRAGVTDEIVRKISLNKNIAHEISHSLVALDVHERLGKHSAWVKELYCDLLALKGNYAIAKSKREKELAFATAFAEGKLEYNAYMQNNSRFEYYIGDSIVLNFCLQKESIKINDGRITWNDPNEVIGHIDELFEEVDKIQKNGEPSDAYELSNRHFDPAVYRQIVSETKIPAFLLRRPSKS